MLAIPLRDVPLLRLFEVDGLRYVKTAQDLTAVLAIGEDGGYWSGPPHLQVLLPDEPTPVLPLEVPHESHSA